MASVPQRAPVRRVVPVPVGPRRVRRSVNARRALPKSHGSKLRLVPTGPGVVPTRTIRQKSKRRVKAMALAAGIVAAAAVVFGLVLVNIFLAQSSFRLSDLEGQVAEQEARYRQLRFEVARAESPERIAHIASRLGLRAPDKQEYILGPAAIAAGPREDGTRMTARSAPSLASGNR
jgi:cell division protein FtsL